MTITALYPYLTALHITAVVFFVGTMLSHSVAVIALRRYPHQEQRGPLQLLQRMDRTVTTPALLLVWSIGLLLMISGGWFRSDWLTFKLVFVVALSALHGVQSGRLRRSLREGVGIRAIPGTSIGIVISMVAIAILVVFKPM